MELTPVAAKVTQDIQVDIAPTDGATPPNAAAVTGFAVQSSDATIVANGVQDPAVPTRQRCVSTGTEGSAALTITATAGDGTLLTDHVVVTFTKTTVATALNSVVTPVDK